MDTRFLIITVPFTIVLGMTIVFYSGYVMIVRAADVSGTADVSETIVTESSSIQSNIGQSGSSLTGSIALVNRPEGNLEYQSVSTVEPASSFQNGNQSSSVISAFGTLNVATMGTLLLVFLALIAIPIYAYFRYNMIKRYERMKW